MSKSNPKESVMRLYTTDQSVAEAVKADIRERDKRFRPLTTLHILALLALAVAVATESTLVLVPAFLVVATKLAFTVVGMNDSIVDPVKMRVRSIVRMETMRLSALTSAVLAVTGHALLISIGWFGFVLSLVAFAGFVIAVAVATKPPEVIADQLTDTEIKKAYNIS